ncbi:amidase signature enzyme [Penicillium verhagenii]|nr:amidase signature enzyme [Penicillium verhagenii]
MPSFPHAWKAGSPPPGVGSSPRSVPLFNALTATAHELQALMISGALESTDLVEEYIWRIEKHNSYLNAIFEYSPTAMQRAADMDTARQNGEFIGPLHGIPIVLKDNLATEDSLGMNTTAGASSLWGSTPSKNAAIINRLLDAGAVIIGKATLPELGFHKGENVPCGWSSVAGQGQSAYVYGGFVPTDGIIGHSSPAGSSSSPVIAISAGLTTLAVGTDTEGSITSPAARGSLYSIRPTTGIVPVDGIIPLAHSFDTAGPLAKDVLDVADLLTILVDCDVTTVPDGGYRSALGGSWSDLRVGTLDVESWLYPDVLVRSTPEATEQMVHNRDKEAYCRIAKLAGSYHENVDLRSVADFVMDDGTHSVSAIFHVEFKDDLANYLTTLKNSNIRSLQEMVDWNSANPSEGLPDICPGQSSLITSLTTNYSDEKVESIRKQYGDVGSGFEDTLKKYDIDVIIGPGDSFFTTFVLESHDYVCQCFPI